MNDFNYIGFGQEALVGKNNAKTQEIESRNQTNKLIQKFVEDYDKLK